MKEALRERKYFLDTAPHLSSWLPIMIPVQKWWQAPYFWAGTKFYDFLAGSEGIESSYFLTKSRAMDAFPMLRKDNLFGALVYYGTSKPMPCGGRDADSQQMAPITTPA